MVVLGAAMLLAGALAVAAPALAAEFQLKGVSNSRPQVQFKMWEWMEQEIPKRTNGRVAVTPTSLPELGLTGFELVRVMKAGLVDLADVLPTYVSGDVPLVEGVDLPGFFSLDEWDKGHKSHVAWHKVMKANQDKLGGVFLGSYGYAYQVLFSRKPVQSLTDLKGMKVRVFGAAQTDFIRALGAEPVSLTVAEVYSALERGTVDAAITGTIAGYNLKWYEVTKHMVDFQIGPVMIALVASKRMDVGMTSTLARDDAHAGRDKFQDVPGKEIFENLRAMFVYGGSVCHWLTRADSASVRVAGKPTSTSRRFSVTKPRSTPRTRPCSHERCSSWGDRTRSGWRRIASGSRPWGRVHRLGVESRRAARDARPADPGTLPQGR